MRRGRPADHILAARFLQRFVKDGIPWIHIDLSSGTHKIFLAHIPSDITGFGVRLALHLLLDKGILGRSSGEASPDLAVGSAPPSGQGSSMGISLS